MTIERITRLFWVPYPIVDTGVPIAFGVVPLLFLGASLPVVPGRARVIREGAFEEVGSPCCVGPRTSRSNQPSTMRRSPRPGASPGRGRPADEADQPGLGIVSRARSPSTTAGDPLAGSWTWRPGLRPWRPGVPPQRPKTGPARQGRLRDRRALTSRRPPSTGPPGALLTQARRRRVHQGMHRPTGLAAPASLTAKCRSISGSVLAGIGLQVPMEGRDCIFRTSAARVVLQAISNAVGAKPRLTVAVLCRMQRLEYCRWG